MPGFVALLVNHRPKALRGRSLAEALGVSARQPARLPALFGAWNRAPEQMYRAAPTLVFAVIGQAPPTGSSRRRTKACCSPSCSRTGRCAARSMHRRRARRCPDPSRSRAQHGDAKNA